MKSNNATEELIPLNAIVTWPDNPRQTRKAEDIAQLAASLHGQGQLNPMIVWRAPKAKVYMAIEGETRRLALNSNVDAGLLEPDAAIRCWVLDAATTSEQMYAMALALNTIRNALNPIEEMENYAKLADAGMKPKAIAEMFGLTERVVRGRLALGNLIESARDLVRTGARGMGWAQAMTLGDAAEQARVIAAIEANPAAYNDGHAVRSEFTNKLIHTSVALFPVEELRDCLNADLFAADGGFFTDVDAFWNRQRIEIQKLLEEAQETHKHVKLHEHEAFGDAAYTKLDAGDDFSLATAVVHVQPNGNVQVYTGLMPYASDEDENSGEGSFLDAADDQYSVEHDDDSADTSSDRNGTAASAHAQAQATTNVVPMKAESVLDRTDSATAKYLQAQITAELRLLAATNPRFSMAFLVACTVTQRGSGQTRLGVCGTQIDLSKQTSPVFEQLDNERKRRDRIILDAGLAGEFSPAVMIGKLVALEPGMLETVFAWTVAESITADLDVTTADIFSAVGAEIMATWRVEEPYLETLTPPQLRQVAEEIVKISDMPSRSASRSQVMRSILEGVDFEDAQNSWVGSPSWLPPQITKVITEAAEKADATAAREAVAEADVPQAA